MITMNQLFRVGEGCGLCSVCTRWKGYCYDTPRSHIIPQCILLVYKKIHGSDACVNFIYDFSQGNHLGAAKLIIPMLCDRCEFNSGKRRKNYGQYIVI